MASDLKSVGINFNLAPCADVKTNEKSSIAADYRIYGADGKTVADYSIEFVKAHNDAKVITSLKHFPGLGNAMFDTHKVLPDITKTWKATELIPFKDTIKEFPKEPVLVGHVINKSIDKDNVSSMSEKTIALLKDMHHEGIVLADAVDMSSYDDYDIKEILVKSINEGVNLFIFPNHVNNPDNPKIYMKPEFFIQTVTEAVEAGEIAPEKIDDSYIKITDLKRRFL